MKSNIIFVSGIDTDIGKSVVTGLIARYLLAAGERVITMKMVQTGCVGASEDIVTHRKICGMELLPEDVAGLTAPQIFKFPSSPFLAARLEDSHVDLMRISESVAKCAQRYSKVLIEGAGGLLVPLSHEMLTADFVAREGWSTVLVSCGRLGSVNHTLLSLEAAANRGIHISGVVYNWHPNENPVIENDTEKTIRQHLTRLGYPNALVRVPRISSPSPHIDFSPVLPCKRNDKSENQ